MLGVKGIAEAVMHAVQTDVHEVKVIPFLLGQKPAHNLPLLLAHAENFFLEPVLTVSAKVRPDLCFFAFDLTCDGKALRTERLIDRKQELRRLLANPSPRLRGDIRSTTAVSCA